MPRIALSALILLLAVGRPSAAQQVDSAGSVPIADQSSSYTVSTVLGGLHSPTGLAIRGGLASKRTFDLFIAESGLGRVVLISVDRPEEIREVITGFARRAISLDSARSGGLLGLQMLTPRSKLIVSGGSTGDSDDMVRVYLLPDQGDVLSAEQSDQVLGSNAENVGGHHVGLAKTQKAAFFATSGDEHYGWILKSNIEANRLADLKPLVATKKETGGGAPMAIAATPPSRPQFLVVGQQGNLAAPHSSLLTFYSPMKGTRVLELPTGLHAIVGLAYSRTGQLYALDAAWQDVSQGGVYRLDDAQLNGQQACRAVKIASVSLPSALVFAPDGALYVAALGEAAQEGTLLKIVGEF